MLSVIFHRRDVGDEDDGKEISGHRDNNEGTSRHGDIGEITVRSVVLLFLQYIVAGLLVLFLD